MVELIMCPTAQASSDLKRDWVFTSLIRHFFYFHHKYINKHKQTFFTGPLIPYNYKEERDWVNIFRGFFPHLYLYLNASYEHMNPSTNTKKCCWLILYKNMPIAAPYFRNISCMVSVCSFVFQKKIKFPFALSYEVWMPHSPANNVIVRWSWSVRDSSWVRQFNTVGLGCRGMVDMGGYTIEGLK